MPLTAVLLLGATPCQRGLLAAAGSLAVLLFGLLAGVVVGRVRRRPVMIWCDLGRGLLLATVPFAAWQGWLSFGHLMAVVALTGVLTVLFDRAAQTALCHREVQALMAESARRFGSGATRRSRGGSGEAVRRASRGKPVIAPAEFHSGSARHDAKEFVLVRAVAQRRPLVSRGRVGGFDTEE